jgi:hypothetical protein
MARRVIKILIDPETDRDILNFWLGLPYTERSSIGRQILRRHLQHQNRAAEKPPTAAEIRRIFEAVLEEKLAGLSFSAAAEKPAKAKDFLADLDDSLLLD